MGDTDELKAKASQALGSISTPSADDVAAAAEAVKTAATKAKENGDSQLVAASEGYFTPEEADFDWIVPYVAKFHERSPDTAAAMADDLGQVRTTLLSQGMSAVSTVAGAVENWQGDARDSFHKYVLEPFPAAVKNQTEVVDELRCAMWAYQAVLAKGRIDAKAIADSTVNVLEGLDDFKSSDATVTLSVVGSAGDLVSALKSTGELDLALLSGSGSPTPASVSTEHDIDGYDVNSVLDSMKRALDALEKAMDEEESHVGSELAVSNSRVDELLRVGTGASDADYLRRTALLPAEPPGGASPRVTDTSSGDDKSQFRPA